jgi:hypothetical protein
VIAEGDIAARASADLAPLTAIVVSKKYAAGLEIRCPGGACIKPGRNSQLPIPLARAMPQACDEALTTWWFAGDILEFHLRLHAYAIIGKSKDVTSARSFRPGDVD